MRSVLIGTVESTRVALETLIVAQKPPMAVFSVAREIAYLNSDYVDLEPYCKQYNIPFYCFYKVNDSEVVDVISRFEPDILWVIGLSQIIGKSLLSVPRVGAIGFHPSALPQNRGRGVIPWTIIQGLTETGSTLFWLDEGIDSGPIAHQKKFAVSPEETARTLMDKHLTTLREMLLELIPKLERGERPAQPQDESQATWCARRTPDDGLIDWGRSARDIWTLVRAVSRPYPGAFTFFQGEPITIWSADLVEDRKGTYWGFPGQIQDFWDGRPLVQCGDGHHILLGEVSWRAKQEMPVEFGTLKRHARFGR